MQNKPNLLNAQMNVISVITKYYENKRLCRREENKPNQSQYKAKMKLSFSSTRNYNNEQRTMNYSKQTQSNPTCGELVEPVEVSNLFQKGY